MPTLSEFKLEGGVRHGFLFKLRHAVLRTLLNEHLLTRVQHELCEQELYKKRFEI